MTVEQLLIALSKMVGQGLAGAKVVTGSRPTETGVQLRNDVLDVAVDTEDWEVVLVTEE